MPRLPVRSLVTLFCVAVPIALLGGCAESLPRYPMMNVGESVEVLADRADRVSTISGAGTLTVRSPERGAVRLEAAIVGRKPDQLRVRAWKLGRSMANILLDGDSADAEIDPRVEDTGFVEGLGAMRDVLLAIDRDYFKNSSVLDESSRTFVISGTIVGGAWLTCEIDRETLTIRKITHAANGIENEGASSEHNPTNKSHFELTRYRMIEQIAWPMRIRAARDHRVATLSFDWAEFNAPIPRGVLPDPASRSDTP